LTDLSYYSQLTHNKKDSYNYRLLHNFEFISSTKIKKNNRLLTSFCSNDYLGISFNKNVIRAAKNAISKYGAGSASSRFVCGNLSLYKILEQDIANYMNCDDSIIFSSGYITAIGVIPALVGKNDIIIADKLIHSCLIDAAILSKAKLLRFNHNDIVHCQKLLDQNRDKYNKCLIITESVFSMDGDLGDIKQLHKLSNTYNSMLLIDYAHDIDMNDKIIADNIIKMGTLSKSIANLGGFIAANNIIIDYLRNYSKSLIYSTALPPSILAGSVKALEIIRQNNLQKKLYRNITLFCSLTNINNAKSAIIPIIVKDSLKALNIAKLFEEKGYLLSAIRPPTVAKNSARLRITINANHMKKDIINVANLIKEFC
jgi:8-amino-7-oxononanoate synthase